MARKPKAETPETLELTALEMAALSQVAKDAKTVRDQLVEGKGQQVGFTVRVIGAVSVGPDHTAKVKDKVDTLLLIGLLLERIADRTRRQVMRDVQDACDVWASGGDLPELSAEAKELATQLLEGATRESDQPRRGPVTASLNLELIDRVQARAA